MITDPRTLFNSVLVVDGTERAFHQIQCPVVSWCVSLQIPNFLMSQVRKLNENSNRRYQFYDRRIKNLLRKIHTDSREKPDKNSSEVSVGPSCTNMMGFGENKQTKTICRDADALKSSALRSLSSQQLVRTVKIQVGDVVSGTMEYQLEVSSRASDLLAQFHLRSSENGKGKLRRCAAGRWWRCSHCHL